MKNNGPKLSRRELLAATGALALTSVPGIDALGAVLEGNPELAKEILALQIDLTRTGRYGKALRDRNVLMTPLLQEMIGRMSRVSEELGKVYLDVGASETSVGRYIISEQLPGLAARVFKREKEIFQNGKYEKDTFANTFLLESRGAVFEFAPYHAVRGSVEEHMFVASSQNHDVAARYVAKHEYIGRVFRFDKNITREAVTGWVGVTKGERPDSKGAFYGALVPMTSAFFNTLFEGTRPQEPIATYVRNGFWKILPPELGDEDKSRPPGIKKMQGYSGAIEVAYSPQKRGYTPVGSLMGFRNIPRGHPLAGRVVGFYNGPEALKNAIEKARAAFGLTR